MSGCKINFVGQGYGVAEIGNAQNFKIDEITSSRIKELADIIDKAQVEALTSGESFNKGFGIFCAKKIIEKGYRKND